jgi:vitamin-K-epoxide reductase (warfarin-sensitive)
MAILLLGIAGLLTTLYAIKVEKNEDGKKSLCDVNDGMSCTRVLKSPYARMTKYTFGLSNSNPLNQPNTYYGVLFYLCVIVYHVLGLNFPYLFLTGCIASCLASCGLAYVLYSKLHDFCLVCATTYVINGALLYNAVMLVK